MFNLASVFKNYIGLLISPILASYNQVKNECYFLSVYEKNDIDQVSPYKQQT